MYEGRLLDMPHMSLLYLMLYSPLSVRVYIGNLSEQQKYFEN